MFDPGGIDLLTVFLIAFSMLVIGVALLSLGTVAGTIAMGKWLIDRFIERQQRRIRIERGA